MDYGLKAFPIRKKKGYAQIDYLPLVTAGEFFYGSTGLEFVKPEWSTQISTLAKDRKSTRLNSSH